MMPYYDDVMVMPYYDDGIVMPYYDDAILWWCHSDAILWWWYNLILYYNGIFLLTINRVNIICVLNNTLAVNWTVYCVSSNGGCIWYSLRVTYLYCWHSWTNRWKLVCQPYPHFLKYHRLHIHPRLLLLLLLLLLRYDPSVMPSRWAGVRHQWPS